MNSFSLRSPFLSTVIAVLLLLFRKEIYFALRIWPVKKFKEFRCLAILIKKAELNMLHDDRDHLLVWFLSTTLTTLFLCCSFYLAAEVARSRVNLPFHPIRELLVTALITSGSTLPMLWRLYDYDNTIARLDRWYARYAD